MKKSKSKTGRMEALPAQEPRKPVPDEELQALLSPDGSPIGVRIMRRVENPDGQIAYLVHGGEEFVSRERWVLVPGTSTPEVRVRIIRQVLREP